MKRFFLLFLVVFALYISLTSVSFAITQTEINNFFEDIADNLAYNIGLPVSNTTYVESFINNWYNSSRWSVIKTYMNGYLPNGYDRLIINYDGGSYVHFVRLTSGNSPSLSLNNNKIQISNDQCTIFSFHWNGSIVETSTSSNRYWSNGINNNNKNWYQNFYFGESFNYSWEFMLRSKFNDLE